MSAVFHSRNDIAVRTSDGRHFVLMEPVLVVTEGGAHYRVPVGADTDGASIPHELWSLGLPPFGGYWLAAVVHDAAYRGTLERQMESGDWAKVMLPKEECDLLFLDLMMALGVEETTRSKIFEGVRLFGWRAFREDRKGVAAGVALPS